MKINNLYGRAIFVDANALIYYLEDMCSEIAADIIEAASKEVARIKLVTTTRVCDEVLFKITLIRAKRLDPSYSKDTVKKLKKNPGIVREIAAHIGEKIVDFFNSLNIDILPVDKSILFGSLRIMKEYGIFGNDAISVYVMHMRNMKYILSSDKDFDAIGWITRIEALKTPCPPQS